MEYWVTSAAIMSEENTNMLLHCDEKHMAGLFALDNNGLHNMQVLVYLPGKSKGTSMKWEIC